MPAVNEVFKRPLVTSVHFQVTFPHLFSIEAKIGDFQSEIMQQFPDSTLLVKQQFMLIQRVGAEEGPKGIQPPPADSQQVWQFKNDKGVTVDVSKGSLVVSSLSHKTYSHADNNKFRDIIQVVCENFFRITRIPLIHRIGLRYLNDCPLSQVTTERYRKYYNGVLPLDRFPLETTQHVDATVVADSATAKIRWNERFDVTTDPPGCKLILDLDASTERIKSGEILATADILHGVIAAEFGAFATDELLTYMRNDAGESP